MDLGRPVARHTIRRAHEVITLDPDQVKTAAEQSVEATDVAEPETAGTERSER